VIQNASATNSPLGDLRETSAMSGVSKQMAQELVANRAESTINNFSGQVQIFSQNSNIFVAPAGNIYDYNLGLLHARRAFYSFGNSMR
jgi:hypothetical protein